MASGIFRQPFRHPSRRRFVPFGKPPQMVTLDTLSLESVAETITVVPGATSVPINTLALVSVAETITPVPGAVSTIVNTLALASSVLAVTAVPGIVAIVVNVLALAGSAENIIIIEPLVPAGVFRYVPIRQQVPLFPIHQVNI